MLVRIRLHFLQRVVWRFGPRDDQQGNRSYPCDRCELFQGIVLRVCIDDGKIDLTGRVQQQGVSIWFRSRHVFGADHAGRPGLILNDYH